MSETRGSPGLGLTPQRVVAIVLVAAIGGSLSASAELPQYDELEHLGVGSCSASPCHGRTSPGLQAVAQDEYVIWSRRDPHSHAYEILHTEKSARIARKLGMKEPAYESDLCLDCHADNVPTELRGPRFAIEDGISCEACHGGGQKWLRSHDKGNSHQENVALGLYPTDDAIARAELCLSCHLGTMKKFVKHRMMGAGHPRIRFELRVFGRTQPPHFRVDDDYVGRGKMAPEGAKLWAIGQAIAVRETIDGLMDPVTGHQGMWPEFAFFDCHACHHPISDIRWRPRASTGLGPGSIRVNDSNLLMLRHALSAVDPEAAEALGRETRRLHRSMSEDGGNPKTAAAQIRARALAAITTFSTWPADVASIRAILDKVLAEGIAGEYRDFAGAEQASMAVQALVENLYARDAIGLEAAQHLFGSNDALLDSLVAAETFQPAVVMHAFEDLRSMLH
jgi:hypothetical protein